MPGVVLVLLEEEAAFNFFDFLAEIFGKIFDTVLGPVLDTAFNLLFNIVGMILKPLLAGIFLMVYMVFLRIVDWLSAIFDIFSGLRYVTVKGTGNIYLLDYLMGTDDIKTAFLYITIMAFALSMGFTIFSVIKSMSDMTLDGKNPVGKVLGTALKTCLAFLIVPVIMFQGLDLGNRVVYAVCEAISGDYANASMGKTLFLTTATEAVNAKYTFEQVNTKFLNSEKTFAEIDMEEINQYFDAAEIDYVSGYAGSIVLILIMIGCIFLFIKRMFEVLILYVVSPLYVSTMPLDGGAIFGKWRDMFIAKLVSGYGCIFTMKIFLSFVPVFSSSALVLSSNATVNALIKMFIIIGGAWAAYKSQHTLLGVISPEMASQAQQSTGMVVGMAAGMIGGNMAKAAGKLMGADKKKAADSVNKSMRNSQIQKSIGM